MDSFFKSGALIMYISKSKCNIKIMKRFYYLFFYLLIFTIFFFILFFVFLLQNNAASNVFLVRDFCNGSNSFLPASQFYLSDSKLSLDFPAQLIYNKSAISPYQQDNIFMNLAVYKSGDKYIGLTDLLYPPEKINPKEEIEFSNKNISCFIIEKGVFLNPVELIKPILSTSVSIVNVYYLNEEEVAVAFRQNYKNNIIPILIYTYSTYLSGRFAFTSNVYKIEIFLDDDLLYERKLDTVSKKKIIELLMTSSRPQFIKYIISNVTDGDHILKVKVYDFYNNSKEILKKFSVKSY